MSGAVSYAIEADPGRCTASFPTYDTRDAALVAVDVPAMHRRGIPPARVLMRCGAGDWRPVFRDGDYVRPPRGNVHIAVAFDGDRVQMSCGKSWDVQSLVSASDELATERPCHACWDAM